MLVPVDESAVDVAVGGCRDLCPCGGGGEERAVWMGGRGSESEVDLLTGQERCCVVSAGWLRAVIR